MNVIDVSEYQIGLAKKVNDKVIHCDGIIARVTTKTNRIDATFGIWRDIASHLGLPFGGYKYTYATTYKTAYEEACIVCDELHGCDMQLGIWLDMETDHLRGNKYATADVLSGFKDGLKSGGITLSGVYCDNDFYNVNKSVLQNERLWIAKWSKKAPDIWYDSENCIGWQHTAKYLGYNLDCSEWKVITNTEKVLYNPDNVRLLQNYLNKEYGYRLKADGIMGTKTFTAVCQTIAK